MRILPYGDRALLVEVADLDAVLALYVGLRARPPYGVIDLVPAARTVLVVFDASQTDAEQIEAAVRASPLQPAEAQQDSDLVELPVVYDGADLESVSALAGLPVREVVERHTGPTYVVAFCGFAPGFAYLVGGDPALAVPRLETPRARVPAGSVGLAGEYSGVYPRASPGGWQLIGRTDAVLWSVDREPPALLPPGTRVRFVEVLT